MARGKFPALDGLLDSARFMMLVMISLRLMLTAYFRRTTCVF